MQEIAKKPKQLQKLSKLKFLVIAIFLISLGTICCEAYYREQIFSGGILNDQIVQTAYKTNLSSRMDESELSTLVTLQNGPKVIVTNNTCESQDNFIICFEGLEYAFFNSSQQTKTNPFGIINQAKIKVYAEVAQVGMTKAYDKGVINSGEQTKLTIKLKNNGARKAERIGYTNLFYGLGVEAESATGCTRNSEYNVTWIGELGIEQEHECIITIKGAKEETAFNQGFTGYWNGEKDVLLIEQPPSKVLVQDFTLLIKDLHKETANIGDEFYYNFSLNSSGSEIMMTISPLEILVDAGLKVIGKSAELSQSDSNGKTRITWSGSITKLEPRDFYLKLKAANSGRQTIDVKAYYYDESVLMMNRKVSTINILGAQTTPQATHNAQLAAALANQTSGATAAESNGETTAEQTTEGQLSHNVGAQANTEAAAPTPASKEPLGADAKKEGAKIDLKSIVLAILPILIIAIIIALVVLVVINSRK